MKEEKEEKEEEEVGEETDEVEVVEEEEPSPQALSPALFHSLKNNLHLRTAPGPTHQPGYGCRASARCDITPPRLLLPVSRPWTRSRSRPRSHIFHHWSKCQYD